jgi:hypothetical protein
MQKLIDGKLYDTDEAEKIVSWSTGGSRSDFSYMKETLYRTENDRWFIHGEGHAKTRYASSTADGMKGFGEDIRALSDEEAFQWCQRKNKVGKAQEHFPGRIEPA